MYLRFAFAVEFCKLGKESKEDTLGHPIVIGDKAVAFVYQCAACSALYRITEYPRGLSEEEFNKKQSSNPICADFYSVAVSMISSRTPFPRTMPHDCAKAEGERRVNHLREGLPGLIPTDRIPIKWGEAHYLCVEEV